MCSPLWRLKKRERPAVRPGHYKEQTGGIESVKKDFGALSAQILEQFSKEAVTDIYGKPVCAIGRVWSEMVPMRDGTRLHTTIMLPEPPAGSGAAPAYTIASGGQAGGRAAAPGAQSASWPAVLIRNPYVALADASLYRFYNLYGYAVVYQEVRGKGQSEGRFEAWDNERFDGIDTVRFIQHQEWYDGTLYLVGSSYTAFVHMTMLEDIMQDVRGAVLRVFTPDFRRALYENGVWHLDMITPWLINTEYDFTNDGEFVKKYTQALEIRPFEKAIDTVMGKSYPWHQQMISSPDEASPFWSESHWARLRSLPEKINIPLLLIDGWYDPFCPGLLRMWDKIPKKVRQDCAMIVGPWVHDCVIQEDCAFDMPHGEILGVDGSLGFLDWLNHIQYGQPAHLCVPGKIRYYVMGSDTWKCTDTFNYIKLPDGVKPYSRMKSRRLYLDENRLTPDEPKPSALSYDYDPNRPTSFWGGEYFNNFMPGGMMKQSRPFRYRGILNFISDPLTEDMEMTGYADVFLEVTSNCEDTVFIARLDVVTGDETWNVREGASLMSRGTVLKNESKNRLGLEGAPADSLPDSYWLHIRLWPSAWHLKAGWRLRLDIASSNYPAYLPFGNTKEPWAGQTELIPAKNTIFTGKESFIEFYVVPSVDG